MGCYALRSITLRLPDRGRGARSASEKTRFETESKSAGRTLGDQVERKRCSAGQVVAGGESSGGDWWLDASAL